MPLVYDPNVITVSGVGAPLSAIEFPSGQFAINTPGANLCAFLTALNASFGFNLQPHQFQTEWVPCGIPEAFHGASGQLPRLGSRIEFYIGSFLVRGRISHTDYTSSTNGTIINISIEDDRRILQRVKLHTEDLGENVPSGVVSIARAFRRNHGLTTNTGSPSDPLIKEYDRILQFGATYSQILEALNLSFVEGRTTLPISDLPSIEQIERNIGGTVESIRFQFNLTPLDEAITRILQDTGYDWYWNMDGQKINLINKKAVFDISESDILNLVSQFGSTSGLNETSQIGFGQDIVPDPTRFRLLGGHQEGIINSTLLSPIDGLDTSSLDGRITFNKAWDRISVGFFDADGFYRTYIPADKELQMALAGIEQWTYFKKYQSTSAGNLSTPGFGLSQDAGSIAAQHYTFQSRIDPLMPIAGGGTGASESGIRVISNRRDEEHNWVIEFYNRVRNHASRHYGRSFIAEGILYNQASGLYRLIDAAWANVENQVQGYALSSSGVITSSSGVFVEDYEINRALGPISPFVTDDFRIRAHCILPANTVYGPQGDDVPASFGNWTEDAAPFNPAGDGRHYIPVELKVVGQRVINPRADELYGFELYPEGTLLCQLPIIAGDRNDLAADGTVNSLATLLTTRAKLSGSGLRDIINPAITLTPYDELTTVAIPVEGRPRYGQGYPTTWVQGVMHYERDEDVQLDDQFVPWAFSPEGSKTSLTIMTERAMRRVEGKIVPRSSSRYADFTQVGLPLLSFDAFASQSIGASGLFGEISHGVNELNISFSDQGFSTRYKIQSYFPKFGRDAPLGERVRALINGIINPIDFTDLDLLKQSPGLPSDPFLPGDESPIPLFFDEERRAVRVTITEVNNVFTLSSSPGSTEEERYRGRDRQQYIKPPVGAGSTNKDFTDGAICIDGFLNIDDDAIYHTDEFELPNGNLIFRYMTQGRPFANGTIVQVERTNPTNSSNYDVTIVDPTSGLGRAIFDVPVLNGTVTIGQKTTLAAQGNAEVRPGLGSNGIYLNPTSNAGVGVVPVEIISLSNRGSTSATAIAQVLNISGLLETAGQTYSGVIPFPYRQFAQVGDQGFLGENITVPVVGGASTSGATFMMIIRQAFTRFTQ